MEFGPFRNELGGQINQVSEQAIPTSAVVKNALGPEKPKFIKAPERVFQQASADPEFSVAI